MQAKKRWKTREVMVGPVGVGGDNPIRIQSMTTSNTRDTEATIEQIIRLADAGCEIARVTVQGMKEAEACEAIKNGLLRRGYTIPLVADIHFFPPAALRVIDFVDKVRINPGNFADKRASFRLIEYDDASYAAELERIEEKFTPLVEKCKRLKRAMRIGTNHGSLSDRILNRYGDTPEGMVESAFEFARICRKHDFHDIIFSMKASNPKVMIQAYRLLIAEMQRLGWSYPLHLGVTEAGDGEDGRIKSALGIGSLLMDGFGDTIRVSLTEDPWFEIDPCQRLLRLAEERTSEGAEVYIPKKRAVSFLQTLTLHRDGSVLVKLNEQIDEPVLAGYRGAPFDLKRGAELPDAILLEGESLSSSEQKHLHEAGIGILSNKPTLYGMQLYTLAEALQQKRTTPFSLIPPRPYVIRVVDESISSWESLGELSPAYLIFAPLAKRIDAARGFFAFLAEREIDIPVILHFSYDLPQEDLLLAAAIEAGSLLIDGYGEGLLLETPYGLSFTKSLAFRLLQAARMRMSRTEYISCPSCGRTLFDLQDVTRRIRAKTDHLPGLKIAIMGCIVNGPGEMADADFGYVGSRPGAIDLYVGKTCVEKNIPFAEADARLIALIKEHGRWIEPVGPGS